MKSFILLLFIENYFHTALFNILYSKDECKFRGDSLLDFWLRPVKGCNVANSYFPLYVQSCIPVPSLSLCVFFETPIYSLKKFINIIFCAIEWGWETKGHIEVSSLLPMHEEGQKSRNQEKTGDCIQLTVELSYT